MDRYTVLITGIRTFKDYATLCIALRTKCDAQIAGKHRVRCSPTCFCAISICVESTARPDTLKEALNHALPHTQIEVRYANALE